MSAGKKSQKCGKIMKLYGIGMSNLSVTWLEIIKLIVNVSHVNRHLILTGIRTYDGSVTSSLEII